MISPVSSEATSVVKVYVPGINWSPSWYQVFSSNTSEDKSSSRNFSNAFIIASSVIPVCSLIRNKAAPYLPTIDLPPGTGDVQLTLAQKIPVSGAIIVTTPQDIALLDARKGLKMFEKVEVPVLGIVENMSLHICGKCGNEEPIFGEGGGPSLADESKVDLLGKLPLDISIRRKYLNLFIINLNINYTKLLGNK